MKTKTTSLKALPAAALTAVLLLPAAAEAQTGCRIYCGDGTSYPVECDSTSTVDRCVGSGGPGNPGGGIVLPPPQVDARVEQHRRYRALISRGLVDDARFSAAPVDTEERFLSVLASLHASLSRSVIASMAQRNYSAALSKAEWATYREYYQPRLALVDASGIVPKLRDDRDTARRRFEEAERERIRVQTLNARMLDENGPIRRSGNLLQEEAFTTKLLISAYLGGLTPSEVESTAKSIIPVPEAPPEPVAAVASPWYLTSRWALHPSYQSAIDAAKADLTAARGIPVIGGNADSRLSACEMMAEEAAAAARAASETGRAYKAAADMNKGAAMRWAVLSDANMALWVETQELRHQAAESRRALERGRQFFKSATWKTIADSSRAVAWKQFRKHSLVPELKRMSAELYGEAFLRADSALRDSWRLGAPVAARSFSAYSRYKQVKSFQDFANRLNGRAEESILAAAEQNADPAMTKEAYGSVFSGAPTEVAQEAASLLDETELPAATKQAWIGHFLSVN